jgi:ATP-dependent DNA helicase RecG
MGLAVTDQLLLDITSIRSNGLILPFPIMKVCKAILEGKEIVVIEVEPSPDPPVRFRGRVQIRVGPRRDVATRDEERNSVNAVEAGMVPSTSVPCERQRSPTWI